MLRFRKTCRIKDLIEAAGWALQKELARQNAGKQVMHAGNGITDGHGSAGIAVVGPAQGGQTGFARLSPGLPVLQGHFERGLHSHGPGIREKDLVQSGRRQCEELFCQRHGRLVGQTAEHDMRHARGLLRQSAGQFRAAVAQGGAPPGGHAVHHFTSVSQPDTHA